MNRTWQEYMAFPRFLLVYTYQQGLHLWDHLLPLWPPSLILFYHLQLNLLSGLLPSYFHTRTLYTFLFSPLPLHALGFAIFTEKRF